MRSRALRCHHENRVKARVASYYGGYAAHDPRAIGKLAHSRAPCSCFMCGNPRRYLGALTLQEWRVDRATAEQAGILALDANG